MLRHIVLVGFKSDATADQRAAVQQAIAAMPAAEPEILALSWGENVGSGPNHFDLAVVIDFADIDAFRRYVGGRCTALTSKAPPRPPLGASQWCNITADEDATRG